VAVKSLLDVGLFPAITKDIRFLKSAIPASATIMLGNEVQGYVEKLS